MESDGTASPHARHGADEFRIAQRLTVAAWIIGAVLQVCLFVRPTPFGTPYVRDWYRYFFRALLYEGLSNYLLALPFLVFWLATFNRATERRTAHAVHRIQALLLAIGLFYSQFDHEIMRFVGTRATYSYLEVYANAGTSWPVVFDALRTDQGGPLIPVVLWFGAPALCIWWSRRIMRAFEPWKSTRVMASVSLIVPIAVPIYVREFQGGKGPTRRVEPVLFSIAEDLAAGVRSETIPADFSNLVKRQREEWLAEDTPGAWRFVSDEYPYLREPVTPTSTQPAGPRWNVILFQLESFRAWNMALMRPSLPVAPTPFIDALGLSYNGAYWRRHSSFGPPTVNGVLAWNCSMLPHSGELALTTFTYTRLDCLPNALRRHGYRAEAFTGFDPDWDNERLWYGQWYDDFTYARDASGDDRVLMRTAATRLKDLGRSDQPFFASIICITNHYPFTSRDPSQDIAGQGTASERILNTMHYTDTAVQDLIEAIRHEPWFDHTLIVIVGDHGYNLGERQSTPGQFNLYRESVWVPLIIYGAHPQLPHGPHDEPASLLDVAPTIADLLDVHDRTSWLGHSLVASRPRQETVAFVRGDVTFAETATHSLVVDPDTNRPALFDPSTDPLQTHDLSSTETSAETQALLDRAGRQRQLNDYLIRTNRIAPAEPDIRPVH